MTNNEKTTEQGENQPQIQAYVQKRDNVGRVRCGDGDNEQEGGATRGGGGGRVRVYMREDRNEERNLPLSRLVTSGYGNEE